MMDFILFRTNRAARVDFSKLILFNDAKKINKSGLEAIKK